MNTNDLKPATKSHEMDDWWVYLLACLVIYGFVYPFMKRVLNGAEEEASLLATALAMSGMFAGRYLWKVINANRNSIPTWWLVLMVSVMVCLVAWLFMFGQTPMFKKNSLNMLFFGLPFLTASVLLGVMIGLARSGNERNLLEARVTASQSVAELSVLQSQLSPHFLFNTLNNLYGVSITEHEKIPPLLLKLSELLRYSVYETGATFVPLFNEINYLNNYIEFEKLRMGERLHLKTAIEQITDPSIRIAPMMLIVFLENAFKHGKDTSDEKVYIDLEVRTWSKFILFTIRNSGKVAGYDEGKQGGLGLANVRKRLQLLYPGAHDLRIEAKDHEFKVMLQVMIK